MTTPVDAASEPPRAPDPSTAETDTDPHAHAVSIDDICPYLLASRGNWRSASPNRDHRCTAVDPPASLSTDKQRRLCLSADHSGCPAFRAARAARASMLAPGLDPAIVASADAARRPVPRTTAVILEQPRFVAGRSLLSGDWPLAQAALVLLMIAAFVVVLAARLTPSTPTGGLVPVATDTPSPTASLAPLPTFAPTPAPPSVEPSASAVPSSPRVAPSPAAPPPPAYRTKYRVRAGDTLIAIAARYRTTVSAIKKLNGISGSNLRIGQILKIP
jgi:LysM repeat protein